MRALFIGSRIGKIEFPEPIYNDLTVRDAFKNLNWNTPNQLDYSKSNNQSIERMSYVKPGHNWKDIPEPLRGKWTHSSMYRRLEWDKPSVTITNFRKTMLLHPEENRIISVREAARLQGFPDDYIFYGSLASKQQMVADAVPVTMVKIIAESIKEQMDILLNRS
jgi:DNA (cytosine-5)-methyltransferase 1